MHNKVVTSITDFFIWKRNLFAIIDEDKHLHNNIERSNWPNNDDFDRHNISCLGRVKIKVIQFYMHRFYQTNVIVLSYFL